MNHTIIQSHAQCDEYHEGEINSQVYIIQTDSLMFTRNDMVDKLKRGCDDLSV